MLTHFIACEKSYVHMVLMKNKENESVVKKRCICVCVGGGAIAELLHNSDTGLGRMELELT